jgi:hypothetical protein
MLTLVAFATLGGRNASWIAAPGFAPLGRKSSARSRTGRSFKKLGLKGGMRIFPPALC